jgi:hypothetical protein
MMIPVADASLANVGAEALWQRLSKEVVAAMDEIDQGLRQEGACTVSIKIKIKRDGDALTYAVMGGVATPNLAFPEVRGHVAGNQMRVIGEPDQMALPFENPYEEDVQ